NGNLPELISSSLPKYLREGSGEGRQPSPAIAGRNCRSGVALSFGFPGRVAFDRVADGAALNLLPVDTESRLLFRAVDDKAHADRFPSGRGVEGDDPDIFPAMFLAAFVDLEDHSGGIRIVEHRMSPHLPIGVPGMRIIGIFD